MLGGQAAGKQKGGFVLGGVGNRAEGLREPVPTENSTLGKVFVVVFFLKKKPRNSWIVCSQVSSKYLLGISWMSVITCSYMC